jgi:hypothetical protein
MMGIVRWSTRFALGTAILLSTLLILVGMVAPHYSPDAGSQASAETTGAAALMVMALPMLITVFVAGSLAAGWRLVAWALTGLLGAFAALTLVTIGVFVLPIVLALAAACVTSVSGDTALGDEAFEA